MKENIPKSESDNGELKSRNKNLNFKRSKWSMDELKRKSKKCDDNNERTKEGRERKFEVSANEEWKRI